MKTLDDPDGPNEITRVLVRAGGGGAREEGDVKTEAEARTKCPEDGWAKEPQTKAATRNRKGQGNRVSPQRPWKEPVLPTAWVSASESGVRLPTFRTIK